MNRTRLANFTSMIKSESNPRLTHMLRAYGGVLTCTCKSFEFRGACKHVGAVLAMEEAGTVTAKNQRLVVNGAEQA